MKSRLNTEQALAATSLEGFVLVSAGAGSGKTSVLTERTANAVVEGLVTGWTPVSIDRLLAITFTDKAAGELAERVRGALRAAGNREDARRVDGAWISTVHGMCARILRKNALEAGIDPFFSVLDTVEAGRLRARAFEDALGALLGDDEGISQILEMHGPERLAQTIRRLSDDVRVKMIGGREMELERTRGVGEIVTDALGIFSSAMKHATGEAGGDAVCECRELCDVMCAEIRALQESGLGEREVMRGLSQALCDMKLTRKSKGVEGVKECIRGGRDRLLADIAAELSAPLGKAFLRLEKAFTERYESLKAASSALDFDDLQIKTLELLETGGLGEQWGAAFDLAMVDEFQDTDQLQLRLVEILGRDRLCTVGDEHQSIYGFRGAELAVYKDHRDKMLRQGAVNVTLHTNYRSDGEILSFVNFVFGDQRVFGDRLLELQPDPARSCDRTPLGPRVELIAAQAQGAAARPRAMLAAEIADRFAALKEQGFSEGDMAILVRAYTHAEEYADALRERGMDVLVVGGRRFFEQSEVRALRALVRVVANTEDEEALAALLASEMCGLSDDGLLALRRTAEEGRYGLWQAIGEAGLGAVDRRIADVLVDAVADARSRADSASLAEIILRAIEDLGYDAVLLADGARGGQAYANILKFARMAEAFESSGGAGASALTEYIAEKELFADYEAPASLVKDGSQAVRIMSIHGAKGLEFPIVAVPELGASGSGGQNPAAIWRIDATSARLAVTLPKSVCPARSPLTAELTAERDRVDKEEAQRLLYVACTRAEEVLILAGAYNPSSEIREDMLGTIMGSLGMDPCSGEIEETARRALPSLRVTVLGETSEGPELAEKGDAASEDDVAAWLDLVLPGHSPATRAAAPPPARLSASGIQRYEACPLKYAEAAAGGQSRLTSPALALGSAFHALAQLFGEQDEIDAERVSAVTRYHALDARDESRLLAALERYRGSELAGRLSAFRVMREAPFALRVGEGEGSFVLDGQMDVFATRGANALIVDFKTGDKPKTPDEMEREYRRQVDCYALAALRSGYEEVEVVFVRPEVVEGDGPQQATFIRSTQDAERIETELLEIHASMGAASASPRAAYDEWVCRGCSVPAEKCGVRARAAATR